MAKLKEQKLFWGCLDTQNVSKICPRYLLLKFLTTPQQTFENSTCVHFVR